jgi:hypothetical protein
MLRDNSERTSFDSPLETTHALMTVFGPRPGFPASRATGGYNILNPKGYVDT